MSARRVCSGTLPDTSRSRRDILAQGFDSRAALADDDAWLGGMDRHRHLVAARSLDLNLRHAGVAQPLLKLLPQANVLLQQPRVLLIGIPARRPGSNDAGAKPDWIYLMTQDLPLIHHDGDVAGPLEDGHRPALRPRTEAFDGGPVVGKGSDHDQVLNGHVVVVLRIGRR